MRQTRWILIVVVLAVSATHAAGLYFIDSESPNSGLRRSNLDGTMVQVFAEGSTRSVAVDYVAGQVYWGRISGGGPDGLSPTIWRANFDGSEMAVVYEPSFAPFPLAVDPIQRWIFAVGQLGEGCDGIQRIPMDGSGESMTVVADCAWGIAVDPVARFLYWSTNDEGIWRSELNGSAKVFLPIDGATPRDIAIDTVHGKIYWSEVDTPYLVQRADLDGKNRQSLATGFNDALGVTLDLQFDRLYYMVREGSNESIYWAELDGSFAERIVVGSVLRGPMAVDTVPAPPDVPAASAVGCIVLTMGLILISSAYLPRNRRSTF